MQPTSIRLLAWLVNSSDRGNSLGPVILLKTLPEDGSFLSRYGRVDATKPGKEYIIAAECSSRPLFPDSDVKHSQKWQTTSSGSLCFDVQLRKHQLSHLQITLDIWLRANGIDENILA
uniref:Uncharacterized protein n=1 Tax=Mesocestoides corti TaxID=53468 RepID=A0A5K3FV10_MESCO